MNDYYAHESTYIDQGSYVGHNTKIWHFSHIMHNSYIGSNCILGQNVLVSPEVRLGNNVKVQNNVSIYTGVTCEDDVFLGPSMVFTNVINPRSFIERKDEFKKTLVKQGASIGANSTIVCGVTIGRFAIVGAGSVVTKDVPDYALVYGVPAQHKGWVCYCGNKLEFKDDKSTCSTCCKRYEFFNGSVIPKDREIHD